MGWLNHPKYVPLRDRLVERLSHSTRKYRPLGSMIFLCGGKDSKRRERIHKYLAKTMPGMLVFYAETVWEYLASSPSASNSLHMEAELADLSHAIVLIVESAGTFAELGAFAANDTLRKKLLPIIDIKYQNSGSFVDTGPLRWIEDESKFSPPIYTDFDSVLLCVDELSQRLSKIDRPFLQEVSEIRPSSKHLLAFICDLIALIGPAPVHMIKYYVTTSINGVTESQVDHMVGLAKALGLICELKLKSPLDFKTVFVVAKTDMVDQPFETLQRIDSRSERAKHMSVLLAIPEARNILTQVASA